MWISVANAIAELRDNPDKRKKMSKAALHTAANLTIRVRAEKIVEFIGSGDRYMNHPYSIT